MKRFVQLALALSAVPLFGTVSEAQNQYVHSIVVTVKPSAVTDFEDYAKKVMAAATKVGSPQRIYGLQMTAGGPQFTYIFSSPFSSFEEMSRWPTIPEMLLKAYGDVEGAKILKAGRATLETVEMRVSRTQTELCTNLKPLDLQATPYIRLIRTEVDPAMTGTYEQYLTKVRAAQEKAPGYPTVARRVSTLGKASIYTSATYLSSIAEIDRLQAAGELLRKAYGEEGAKTITDSGNSAIRNREFWLLHYRPDLSRPQATGPTTE